MSDSDTGCENGSNEDLTPVILLENNYETQSPRNNHRESLSQLDAMMPRMQYGASIEQAQSQVCSTGLLRKRLSDIIPSSIPAKAAVRPPLSEYALREEAIRIVKTFPRGEATMWSIMHAVEYSDMKILCKFLGVKHRLSKVDMGKTILKAIQNGELKNLTNPVSEKKGNAGSANSEKTIVAEGRSSANIASTVSQELNNHIKSPEIMMKVPSIPVVAVGGAIDWKQVDSGLKKLLNENEVIKMEGGIFIKTSDWKLCSPELETELENKNSTWQMRQIIKLLEKQFFDGFRKIHLENYKRIEKRSTEKYNEKYEKIGEGKKENKKNNKNDKNFEKYFSDENLFFSSDEGSDENNLSENDFSRGREKEVLHDYGNSSSPYDDDYSPIFTNNMYKNYPIQNSKNSEKSITEFTNYFPPPKISKLRNRETERKINTNNLNFKRKSEEFVTAGENYDNEKNIKCVIQESSNSEKNVPQKLATNVPQMLMKNILQNEEKNHFNNEVEESEKYLNKEKEKISDNINKIINKIFPELQEHLIKRFSYEKINSSSQTDNNYNFNENDTSKKVLDNDTLILNERKTDFRSFNSVFENNEKEKINETFREINNRFVAMKIIRFDNDKLGLIFAKRNIGTDREIAIIQSKVNSLLPDIVNNMLAIGDILISINGQIVKNQLFNQQIQLIKISYRPITLGFVPDRFK